MERVRFSAGGFSQRLIRLWRRTHGIRVLG